MDARQESHADHLEIGDSIKSIGMAFIPTKRMRSALKRRYSSNASFASTGPSALRKRGVSPKRVSRKRLAYNAFSKSIRNAGRALDDCRQFSPISSMSSTCLH